MNHHWTSVEDLQTKLSHQLRQRYPDLVTMFYVTLDGDTLVLHGEVASEDCKGDAKRLALGFDGLFKVRNELIVAGFLEAASDPFEDFFAPKNENSSSPAIPSAPRETPASHGHVADDSLVEVVRQPTVEASGAIKAGNWVEISVNLSENISETDPSISLGQFPFDWQTIDVTVQIMAPWSVQTESIRPTITVRANGPSDPARFNVLVADRYVSGAPAQIHLSFAHGTRICGHLSKDLRTEPEIEAEPEPLPMASVMTPEVKIAPGAPGPALSVTIINDGTNGQMWMWAAQVPGGIEQGFGRVDLGNAPSAFADMLLRTCPDLKSTTFRRTMRSVGERLWQIAPDGFRAGFLNWRTKIGPNFPIQFVTDDPHVPWEMMKPDQIGIDHLFLEHPVARWPLSRAARRRYEFPGGDILSFVPKYDASDDLPNATVEGAWICSTLGGIEMPAMSKAFLAVLDCEHESPVGILHFAGHGNVDTGIADGGIKMEDAFVSVTELDQSSVVLGQRDGTLMVLNACETSAGAQMLGMNTGWGAAIAAREFGGLIAPLWEVHDTVALSIVQAALPLLLHKKSSLGEAVTAARLTCCENSISAFAYLAHGDVMARFATP